MSHSDQREDTVPTQLLLEELNRGDAEAGRLLIDKVRPDLLAYATQHSWMRALESRRASVEDVVQEALLRALNSGLFAGLESRRPGSLRSALRTVLERVLADHLRKMGSEKHGGAVSMHSLDSSAE